MLILGFASTSFCMNAHIRSYIPSVWTGLGILFTFISFVIGLTVAQNGATGINVDQLMNILPTAFTTSIYGMSMSIFWGALNRVYFQEEDKKLEQKLCMTPEEILLGIHNEMIESNKLLQKNNAQNKKDHEQIQNGLIEIQIAFEKELNTIIINQNALVKKFNTSELNNSFATLAETMKSTVKNLNENLKTSIRRMSEDMNLEINSLSCSLPSVIMQLTNSMDKMNEGISASISSNMIAMNKNMEGMSKNLLKETQTNFAKETAQSIAAYTTMKESMMQEVHDVMEQGVEGFESVMKNLQTLVSEVQNNLNQIQEWNKSNVEAFESATGHYRKAIVEFKDEIKPLYDERIEGIKQEIDFMDQFRDHYTNQLKEQGEKDLEMRNLILKISDISEVLNTLDQLHNKLELFQRMAN